MSQTPTATTSTSNYQSIFDNAIGAYKRKTKKDLRSHPLLDKLQDCDSPDAVLKILYEQLPGFDQSRDTDVNLTKWLSPTVNVLCMFSGVVGGGIGLVSQPTAVIFAGIGILLSTAKAVSDSQAVLATVFERIENFFRRLETYVEVPPTTGMTDIIVKIMIEVLSILSIATKEIKQSRTRKYVKRLVGRTDIEDALGRLDQLTQDEVRMAAAQGLKATHEVDDKVQGVDNKVQGVDERVRDVDGEVDLVIDGGEKIREDIKQVADDQKRNQIRQDLRNWLSPPDPSINFNTASDAHHEGTALWFIQGNTFTDWKDSGSLLWLYGKPGSGKSVLSSSIIEDIKSVCDTGSAHMAYFFFDFKDKGKQDARALLSSFLIQLSHQFTAFCDILFAYHSSHQSGSQQPSDHTLIQCLENMLKTSGPVPIYLIIDALDECPNTTKLPPPREKVLDLIEKLVKLDIPNMHLCVTSRPEFDIRESFEPLATKCVSLHDQSGQKKDIEDYVRSVVYSDRTMKRWRDEDKHLVVETLTEKADGMFRWVFCQLETLRPCLPPSVRPILSELPETLDETYERILQEIPKSNRVHAHRLLQCLTVAIRPLRVEELAEILAVDLNAMDGIPKLHEDLRWEDQEQAVLSACSSLIAAVWDDGFPVVQFSHFSVKEFLTSGRLTTSTIATSRHYHILLEPSHTIMAQACLSVLLRLDSNINENRLKDFPLAQYASRFFGDHAEFGKVFARIQGGIDDLLDSDKPHFAAWLWVREDDSRKPLKRPEATPLYHVSGFGFRAMVDYLISKCPEDLIVRGHYGTPLHVALCGGHTDVALLLLGHCVDVDDRGIDDRTPLHMAVDSGLLEVTRILIERGASINARDSSDRTPLRPTFRDKSRTFDDTYFDVVLYLLGHGADVDAQANTEHSTPLHLALYHGGFKVARLLLDRGVNINVQDKKGRTPLHEALTELDDSFPDYFVDAVRFSLDHGADVDVGDDNGSTPLHVISQYGNIKAARLLLEHGARVDAQDNGHSTPLHIASRCGNAEVAHLLLKHGANIIARNKQGQTPQHLLLAMESVGLDIGPIRSFLERGAAVDVVDYNHSTLLHKASYDGNVTAAQLLLERGANVNARNEEGDTPLHRALVQLVDGCEAYFFDTIQVLLEHGADVDALDSNHSTPLHVASEFGCAKATRLLLEHGANVHLKNNNGDTPSQVASAGGHEEITRLLSGYLQSGQKM